MPAFPHLFSALQSSCNKESMLIGMHLPTDVTQISFLRSNGVSIIVSLEHTESTIDDSIFEHGIEHIKIAWPNFSFVHDADVPRVSKQAKALARAIVEGEQRVAVHCLGGVGRTGCFIAMIIAHICKMTGKNCTSAVELVQYLRHVGPPDAVDSPGQYIGLIQCLQDILGERGSSTVPSYRELSGSPISMMKLQRKYRADWKAKIPDGHQWCITTDSDCMGLWDPSCTRNF
jgi:protein-tyrosine phosphatase